MKSKNKKMYIILAFFLVFLLAIFIFFIYRYIKMDKNTYKVENGSVLYSSNMEYIKVESDDAYLQAKMDGSYYLYETKDNKEIKYKIGKNAIINKTDDSLLYVYGEMYQVLSDGTLAKLVGENKVSMSSPTKFFKLDDRKYLFVDSNIKSDDKSTINTNGYLYIEMDKNGKASYSNDDINFKVLSPVILTGSFYNFDIADEKLLYDEEEIDLKNIIGSTNNYVKKENKIILESDPKTEEIIDVEENEETTTTTKKKSKKSSNNNATQIDVNYYDNYLTSIVTGYNNLALSVSNVAESTKTVVNSKTTYYDFNKWVALKNVETTSSSIKISYSVFDPNSEYDAVSVILSLPSEDDSEKTEEKTYFLNKDNTEYTIRGLNPNTEYSLDFGYKTNSSQTRTVADSVVVKTNETKYDLQVYKVSQKYIPTSDGSTKNQYTIYYQITLDPDYLFSSGEIKFSYMNEQGNGTIPVSQIITSEMVGNSNTYKGTIVMDAGCSLQSENVITLENVNVYDGDSDVLIGNSNLDRKYVFYS